MRGAGLVGLFGDLPTDGARALDAVARSMSARGEPTAITSGRLQARVLGAFGDDHGVACGAGNGGADVRVTWTHDEVVLDADALGRRALFVADQSAFVAFSTEARALARMLAELGIRPTLDPRALRRFYAFSFAPAPRSPWREIRAVPAGTRLKWRRGETTTSDHPFPLDARPPADEAAGPLLRDAVLAAGRRALRPGVTPSILLSGGLDSALVARSLAAASPGSLALTIDLDEGTEAAEARAIASAFGLDHHAVRVDGPAAADALVDAVNALDVPIGDPVIAPFLIAARAARSLGAHALWNGEGGDQLFAGWQTKPMLAWARYAAPGDDPAEAYLGTFHKLAEIETQALGEALLDPADAPLTDDLRPWLTGPAAERHASFLHRLCEANLRGKGAGNVLPRIDGISAAAGLDAVSPLLDAEVVTASFRLAPNQKQRGVIEKWAVREALRDVLPAALVDLPKRGMRVPLTNWLAGPLKDLAFDVLSSRAFRERGHIRPDFAEALLAGDVRAPDLRRRRRDEWLWLVLAGELWARSTEATLMAVFGELSARPDRALLGRMQVALRRRLPEASVVARAGIAIGGPDVIEVDDVVLALSGIVLRDAEGPPKAPIDVARKIRTLGFPAAIRALEGAFVVAAYDRRARSLWLARDATGQRAMYVARTPGGLTFASETKALHARGDVGHTLDELAIARYLSFSYAPGEATLFREIRSLPPGVAVRFDETGDERERCSVFHPREPDDLAARGEALAADPSLAAGYARTLRDALEDVVDAHLEATDSLGPPAAFLSGGIDSSLVVALAARGGRVPKCFSIAFGDDLPNELRFSRMVAEHVGAEHEVVTLGPSDMATALTETAYLLDDPIGDPLTVPNALVARAASATGYRRALNGEGGDPCFGGPKNVPMLLASWYGDEPRDRAYARAYQRFFDDLPRLLTPSFAVTLDGRDAVEGAFASVLDDPSIGSFLNRLQTVNLLYKGAGLILPKVEKTYGAAGLVPLSPLSDRRIVTIAWDTPPTLKLRGNVEKLVLKEAVRDLLPAEIVDRKKSGMLVPVHPWLSGPLAPLAADLLGNDALSRRGMFEPRFVRDLRSYQGATTVRGFYGAKLWLLCTLEAWMRLFVDGGARAFEDAAPRLRRGDDETEKTLDGG